MGVKSVFGQFCLSLLNALTVKIAGILFSFWNEGCLLVFLSC